MGAVVIGMDPHKRSATIEVMAGDESVVGGGRFATDVAGYRAMFSYAKQFAERTWAIEGCNGIGRHLAMRLLADGETVIDVPAKLSARARVFATGQGRKTDATDAHSVALVGTRMAGLRPVVNDEQLTVLRVLADRRRALGEEHNRIIAQLHHLLLELIPGGAKQFLSPMQARALLAKVRPRDAAGKAIRRVAAELVSDLERNHRRTKAADKELRELLAQTGTTLMQLRGIGPSGAARLLVEVGDITRFPDRAHFASWTGTAPIDASSGEHVRHRLSRGGNRQINRVLHTMAIVQLRRPTDGRAYFDRKKSAGKTSMEAMRCLKRRLSDIVYRQLLTDALRPTAAGPGGHSGTSLTSSAADSHPVADSSDQPLPGPATSQPRTASRARLDIEGSQYSAVDLRRVNGLGDQGWCWSGVGCDNRRVSPQCRGRPPGRGRRRNRGRAGTGASRSRVLPPEIDSASAASTECWFDEPVAGDRRSWTMPSGHGSYRGLELEPLDPGDEDELMLLLEAQHAELADALDSGDQVIVDGEPFSPRLHVVMHQIVANQVLADDPPRTGRPCKGWQVWAMTGTTSCT